ncbi:MBL fold metallo-hydrolase [Thalassorhabdomicrobium marinisediminis]|uniref:MBL fold metallo-hydrolase n=1 Tax=Thalassorhabdomicrobium marinisediminis TaxID=2170577 RepID=UPI002492114C|nr:MBL fold metallo-hydrolase [Thalassorhabdomicrobium marinisediminis]
MQEQPPRAGEVQKLEEGLACVLAANASPMTHWGTNSYILGGDRVAVIDPGPASDAHLAALLQAIGGRTVSHILVTHSHVDHSPLARPLARATGAPVLAFGDSLAGRSEVMQVLAAQGDLTGSEGVDPDFTPDICLADGDTIAGDGWTLRALHTPGHLGNHMCFQWGDVVFTGDHVMGWATSVVSPPDGDLTDYMASCHRLAATQAARAYAGHGAPIPNLQHRLAQIIAHRQAREAEILAALHHGPATPQQLTTAIYHDVPKALLPMAQRNVLAHLVDLTSRGVTRPEGPAGTPIDPDAAFSII